MLSVQTRSFTLTQFNSALTKGLPTSFWSVICLFVFSQFHKVSRQKIPCWYISCYPCINIHGLRKMTYHDREVNGRPNFLASTDDFQTREVLNAVSNEAYCVRRVGGRPSLLSEHRGWLLLLQLQQG